MREDSVKRLDGSILTVQRSRPKLTPDAYPSLFENCPAYLSLEPPAKRTDPEQRRANIDMRSNQLFDNWMESDRISSLPALREQLEGIVNNQDKWKYIDMSDSVIFYVLDVSNVNKPTVQTSITVHDDLTVHVCQNEHSVDITKLTWILGNNCKLDCMSKLTTLFSHFGSNILLSVHDKLTVTTKLLYELRIDSEFTSTQLKIKGDNDDDNENDDDKIRRAFRHLHEQCYLLQQPQPRYSAELLRWSFQLFSLSPTAYAFIRESCLMLPHPVYLRSLTRGLNMEPGVKPSMHCKYLEQKCQLLDEHERFVALLLDEIYVNPKVTYKAGNLDGFASNMPQASLTQATTVQAFMLCSLLSSNTDMAALVPVKNINGKFLKDLTVDVMRMVENAGFKVVCLISDNNRINGNTFAALAGDKLVSLIDHPLDSNRKLFFLFDGVHLMKCVRNNWINQKDGAQTLTYPDFDSENTTVMRKACFAAVKQLYDSEKACTVKLAPSLSQKALNPSSTERQSVHLMLRIFNDKVVSALNIIGDKETNFESKSVIMDTKNFISIIYKLWKMLNVKHPFKGRNTRDICSDPVRSIDSEQLLYFSKIGDWLDRWEKCGLKTGCLTKETLGALRHTVRTMVVLCKYLLTDLQFKYVLTGKFQTDKLEYRFSQYRRLAGTNYHVSVREIMESEKKLKLVSLLRLQSSSVGNISIAQFSLECFNSDSSDDNDVDLGLQSGTDIDYFHSVLIKCERIVITDSEMQALVFVAGYIGRKLRTLLCCGECIGEYVTDEEMTCDIASSDLVYLHSLDRGGLCWPTQMLVDIIVLVYVIFQRLISCEHEQRFIGVNNHKSVVVQLAIKGITEQCSVSGTCECGKEYFDVVKMCTSKMANILLNNYMKQINDKCSSKQVSNKSKRKLETFGNSV